ncbi:oogenesin-1-like [Arvicola amphibius]|uniref:oogenesin-1-like n=1 Tax=Arvicola amphibius TaxID=1047088 RepID=UPI0018E2E37C|nr:oogenesin-1-like [Arvicola amphibius]
MEHQAPPTLQRLAVVSLLKKEALAISAVAGLPVSLFPATFEVAFRNNQTNILRAMVPAWPFTCLPLGALMKTPHLETLKALLDGLDMLITEEACPSRGKIRVLDLTNRYFCTKWTGPCDGDFSHQSTRQKKPVETCPYSGVKKYLNVITDLRIMESECDECTTYLWQWAQQRKNSVHLCCRKLEILTSAYFPIAIDFLKSVDLHCVRELNMRYILIKDMASFGPYLRQMRNLHTLSLLYIEKDSSIGESEQLEEECKNKLVSQLPKFHCLQHLYIHYSNALVGSLADCLRCLKKPLESLSITLCYLIQRDLDYLPRCLNLSVLKHLDLSNTMLDRCVKPLGDLLEGVKDTLQALYLVGCGLKDSQFSALMPALSQCSQLLKMDFYMNELSLPVLKQLLHHAAKLNKLSEERYPVPLECYDGCRVLIHIFDELGPELLDILRSERQPKAASFEAAVCPTCYLRYVYDLKGSRCWGKPEARCSVMPREYWYELWMKSFGIAP